MVNIRRQYMQSRTRRVRLCATACYSCYSFSARCLGFQPSTGRALPDYCLPARSSSAFQCWYCSTANNDFVSCCSTEGNASCRRVLSEICPMFVTDLRGAWVSNQIGGWPDVGRKNRPRLCLDASRAVPISNQT